MTEEALLILMVVVGAYALLGMYIWLEWKDGKKAGSDRG